MFTSKQNSNKGKLTIGKWNLKLGFVPVYYAPNYFMIHFGIFKITNFPKEGYMITKENYKGFWFRKQFPIRGFEITL